jgi:hypothetical protein
MKHVVQIKHVFPSDWSFKDEAFSKILLLEDSDNDLNHSDLGMSDSFEEYSQKNQMKCLCQKCGVLLHQGMCDMKYLTLTQQ